MFVRLGTSHEKAVVDRDRGGPALSRQQVVVSLGRGVARQPKEDYTQEVRSVEQDNESNDEPLDPSIAQSEQSKSERSLAQGDGDDRGKTGDIAQDAKGEQVLERDLVRMQTEAETGVGRRCRAAGDQDNLEHTHIRLEV